MIRHKVFPTSIYEMHISRDLALHLLDEIKSNQKVIEVISSATQPHPISDYSTDYTDPLRFNTFWDEVVPDMNKSLVENDMQMEVVQSWVSCYSGPSGHHPLHNHSPGYGRAGAYSGILYLSDIGFTDFFSVAYQADETQYSVPSQLGKVVLFPSIIPHQYRPERYDGNARYVLPFNGYLENNK